MTSSTYIGKVLDNYRIVETIGEGGMGFVLKAVHTKLDKVVALKMIASGLSMNTKFIRRFQTEAQALAKLQNPNIVTIHDLRSHENQWFIVMEYVDGIDLFDIISKDGAFSWQESITIVKQILSAIGHAHNAGIIHRDLKPHNIMLTKDKKVKITDFGLAKDEADKRQTLTVASGGSLNYMSPEHVKGFSYIEKRSDLYCIGIILYEMVTGEVPFKNLDSDFDIRESILRKNFDTPTKINKKIPAELDKIIMKSINKDPKDRFQSAGEMMQALVDFEKGNKFTYTSGTGGIKSTAVKILIPIILILAVMFSGYYFDYFGLNVVSKDKVKSTNANLSIKTVPENAIVLINNDSIAKSPLEAYSLASGTYNLKLSKENYKSIDTSIILEAGKNFSLSFNLENLPVKTIEEPILEPEKSIAKNKSKSILGNLSINSTPQGANVFINNENKGKTPLSLLELNSGNYDVRITNEGYNDYSQYIKLSDGQNQRINAKLVQFAGILSINNIPDDVTLSIDNELKNVKGTTAQITGIPIGRRKIKITKYGYSDYIKEVEIKKDQTTTISATLSQLKGKLIVKIRPWGKIYINNKLQESSTDTKYEKDLAVASYNIRVEHPTLGVWYKDLEIKNKNNTEVVVNFTKKIPVSISAFGENGEPFAGNIFIDDKFIGKTTPQEIKLPVGVHNIKVEKAGFIAAKGQRRLLIEEDYKDPIVFILKENGKAN